MRLRDRVAHLIEDVRLEREAENTPKGTSYGARGAECEGILLAHRAPLLALRNHFINTMRREIVCCGVSRR